MEILKRSLSAFLALVLVLGMLPMPAAASELDIMEIAETEAAQAIVPVETVAAEETAAETELPEPTAAVETLPASEPEETVPALTEPAETEAAVTEPAQTEAQETEPEETEPEETEPRRNRTPLPRDDSYWYVEEKTRTYTDTVTRVVDNGDGSFSSYDETQTFTDTYLERQEVSLDGGVSAMSLTQNGENAYYFTDFEDLKELAAMSFDTWTYAWYEGDEPLMIEESLTLPRYLSLEFYNDNAELIVPAGVTFTIRSGLYVDSLTVAGTLNLASYSRVYKELHVTGQILVESSLMVNSDAVVTGAQNVVAANEWNGPRWYYQDVKSADALEAALSAINRDTSGWKYRIDMSTYDSGITLDRSLFIPGNVELAVNGNNALIIARGSTLTVYGSNVYMNVPLEVRGNLVNESENFNLQSTMSVTGSYSGSGTLYVYASDWTDVVTGLDTANMLITEEREGCWKIRDMSGLTRLGTPQNPTWNKSLKWIDGGETLVNRYGAIAWQVAQPDDNEARIRVYDQATGEELGSYGFGFGYADAQEWRSVDKFILDDPESGTYYFTVTSTTYNNADIYYDSEPAVSGTWTYRKPNTALGTCSNLRFENLTASWTAPAGVREGTEYEVEWYYASSENEEPWQIGSTWGFANTSTQLGNWQTQENGKGYYSFRVRAISDDITRTCNGAWTELSQPFYYDPDTFRFTETYLQQLLDTNGYINLYVPVVLENNFTVPEESNLYIGQGGSITVPSGKTLTVNSGGTIEYGSLLVEVGGRLAVNKYSLYVNEGGTLDVQGSYTRSGDYSYIYQTFKQGSAVSTVNGVAKKDMGARVIVSDTLTWAEDVAILRDTGFGRTELLFRGNVTIPGNFTIPEKCIVTVSYDASLTIPQGVKLTVDGLGMYIYGEVNNYGTIDNDWDIYVDGPYSKLNNYGTINILQPSNSNYFTYLYVGEEGHVVNNGTVNVYKNGQVSIRGTWEGNAPINRGGTIIDGEEEAPVDLWAQFRDAVAESAASGEPLAWEQAVTLGANLTIPENGGLDLMNGGCIIVPTGKTLTINGWTGVWGSSALIIERGGKLIVNGNLWVLENGELTNSGTVTVNESGSITHYYGDPVSITGISENKLTLHINSWREGALEAFRNNTYGKCYLQMGAETLTEDLTIPENGVLLVQSEEEGTFTIPEGVTVTNNGEIRDGENMTVVVDGTVMNHGMMNLYGDLEVYGRINVYGILHTRAAVHNNGGIMDGLGIWVYQGGHMQSDGTITNNNSPVLSGGTYSGEPTMTQAEFIEALENHDEPWDYTLEGTLFLERNLTINKPLEIFGRSLFVPRGVTLTINAPVVIYHGGDLIVEEGGKLVNNSTITSMAMDEHGGVVIVGGTYTHGRNAEFKVLMNYHCGMHGDGVHAPGVTGILNKYQTWYYQFADEEDFTNVMYYAQEGTWGVAGVEVESYNMVLNTDAVIPENAKLVMIQGYADLEHPCGNDWVVINSNLTVHGELEIRDQYLDEHPQLEINGNISLMDGAVMNVSGNVLNNGNVYAFAGSEINYYEEHGYVWEGNDPIALENGQIGGSCGEGVQWTFAQDSGLLTISGQGYMDEFEIGEAPWAAFAGGIKTVQVEDGILHVGNNAFRGLTELTRAVMADSVMNVAYAAFHDCTSLAQVTLSDTLDYIGCSAFSECDSLKTIDLPDTVRWIDGAAFQGSGLTSISIPGTVTNITYNAFQSCEDLASVSLPDTLEYIDYNAFAGCSSLKNVSLPDSVMSLSYASFADCTSLESVRLSGNLQSISEAAFAGCVSLNGISIPGSVSEIGFQAFMNCDSLTNVTIPNSVVNLSAQSFYSCDNLKTVKLSENLTRLLPGLFECCTSLERVRIPAGVEMIMPSAFGNCGTIDKVIFQGAEPMIMGSFRNTTANVYYPENYEYDTTQNYGGYLTWMSYSDDLEIVSTNELDYVLSGKSIQLAAQDYTGIVEAEWEITAGAEYASVDGNGLVTINSGLTENQLVEVSATSLETGATGSFELEVLKQDTKLVIRDTSWDGLIVDGRADLDISDCYNIRPLYAGIPGFMHEMGELTWTVRNARIDNEYGLYNEYCDVEFGNLGTATVTATDPYGITGTVTVNVYFVTPEKKLTASVDAPAIGLQRNEMAKMVVPGVQNPYALEFTVSDEEMAWVDIEDDGDNLYIAVYGGYKPGNVKITASIINDPLNRSVTVPVKIIPAQTETLNLLADGAEDGVLTFSKGMFGGEAYTFYIQAEALDQWDNGIELNKKSIRWTSSNTKLASIKVDEDGNAEVTIKKNADGEAVITAQTTDLAKVSASLTLKVQDLSPRLSDSKVTVNPMLAGGARLMLLPSYGNTIETVAAYTDSDYASFEAQYDAETGVLQLNPEFYGSVRNGNYNVTLDVGCADGYWYEYPIKVTVKSVEPKVTVKQVSKYNLFYTDSVAEFDIAAADAEIEMLGLADCDFSIYQDEETGRFYVCYDGYEDFATKQSDTKGTLYIYLEGYQYPVEKAVTIGTSNVKPKLVMSENGKTMVNIVLTQPLSGFQIYDASNNYEVITDAVGNRIEFTKNKAGQPFVSNWEYTDDNAIQMWLAENNGKYEGGTATVWVQKDNWTEAIKMTHKVTVQTKEPTLKAVNLELNNVFTWREAWQYPTVDQTNIGIARVENITTNSKGAENLEVTYENYRFYARIKDGAAVKAGTYAYTGTPYMWSGYRLKDVTIKVKVVATVPTVKLNTTTVKLNSSLAGREVGVVAATVTNDDGFVLSGFTGMDAYEDAGVYLSYENGRLEAKMDENAVRGKYAYTLYPQFREPDSDIHTATAPKALKLTVEVYDGKAISVTQSGKGKLDAIDPASQILYTISKISNAQGVVESVELIQGEEFFCLSELGVDAKGKQTFALMLKEDVTYSTKANYQVQFAYTICGQTVESAVLKVKVSQSSVKISAPAVNYYLSQSLPLNVQVSLTSPANAKIRFITVNADKTSKEFLQSIEKLLPGKSVGDLNFQFKEAHSLVAGKSYKLVLDITPVGHASDAKATQVTVNVKVMK
ncbi:MAG: leucine-rich repeat domain-containing protein [Oscillospiraceae bacterium]|nr:leucine-rich repeat domain-containing protein [Oscillospiraceae bacterium]